ncbi:MAG: sensor histidine kinase [Acutalibacteraceae bacterium]
MNAQYQDMLDYYTLWAHQIKTPIASMRLCLQQEDTPQARQLLQELSRAEQYVEMVMVYLRLTGGSDLVLREYELDAIVRRAVRRFAGEFIGRKLKLCYEPLNVSCVTDEKWLLFVVEQVLSNALKYTRAGSITIELEAPKTLVIRDTGIGVAPEDLPRIFEKGYTGYNGRGDQKASGLGLYLCRTICKRLGHTITASSVPGPRHRHPHRPLPTPGPGMTLPLGSLQGPIPLSGEMSRKGQRGRDAVSRRLTERLYQICIEKPKPQIQFAVWKGRNEHRG